jgi:hypothetical protein
MTVIFAAFFCFIIISTPVAGVPTDTLKIVTYDYDGQTILQEQNVTILWMESYLPVLGDGTTHYYHQGPVFVENKEEQWDRNETTNFKDMGAVKGTAVRDLCELAGGMSAGDEVMVKSGDGYHVELVYENVYHPLPRQGNITICWYNGEESSVGERQGTGYPPSYHVGMRLVFFADNSTNAQGKCVFGNEDMRVVMPPGTIHLFDNLYPSTSGYTVKWVDEVRVYRGGYRGSADLLPKSFESKMDEAYPAPRSTTAPWSEYAAGMAIVVVSALVLSGRGRI